MERLDALISGGISVVLAICGVLLNRALTKLDEAIQELWDFANESREHRAQLHARVSVLEAFLRKQDN